jgi:ABC-2 type transport system ATP-binding protein
MTTPTIRFDQVHRWFGAHHVLRGLSFDVQPGTVAAEQRIDGAGKTTALRILLGFLQPLAGTATVFGQDCAALGAEHRARIGYVGEEHRLYPTMSVAGAIAFEAGTRPTFRRDFAAEAVRRCGLRGKQRVPLLSRGQRAQLSLVLAVASAPELLICDDPALGLDVVMRREFLDVMIDLLADTGCSVLFSSHFLSDVERVADHVGILHEGRLLVDATLDDLKRRVRRCVWLPNDGEAAPVAGDEVLRVGARRQGFELTLLDAGDATFADLRARGDLSEPVAPSLEDLFLDLTGPAQPGLLREPIDRMLAERAGGVR